MNRGQVQVFWVIIELVLVVVSSFGIFFMIDTARDNKLPEQQYAAKELSFTREAIDIYALSAVYYELTVPKIPFKDETLFGGGNIRVDKARGKYGYDTHILELPYFENNPRFIQMEVAGGIVRGGEGRRISHKLQVSCDPRPITGKIALIPTSVSTQILTTRLIKAKSGNFLQATEVVEAGDDVKVKKDTVESADAVVVLKESSIPDTAIAHINRRGSHLGCKIVNSLVDTIQVTLTPTSNTAVVPISSFENTKPESYLPDDKPGVVLVLDVKQDSDEKLKTAFG